MRRRGPTSTAPRRIRRARPRERRRDAQRRRARRAGRLLLDRLRLRRARSASRTSSRTSRRRSRSTGGRSWTGSARCARAGSSAPRGSSAGRATTSCGRCCASARSRTRWRSSTTSAARRPTSAISRPRRAKLLELPYGIYHVAAAGDCTWAEFAEAIFEEAGLDCRVRRITTAEFGRRRRGRRTRSSAASEARRSFRTGARASLPRSSLAVWSQTPDMAVQDVSDPMRHALQARVLSHGRDMSGV